VTRLLGVLAVMAATAVLFVTLVAVLGCPAA